MVAVAMIAFAAHAQPENPFKAFDQAAFEAHAAGAGATAEQIESFRAAAEAESAGAAADALLRSLFGDYDKAVGLAEDGDPRAALELAGVLAKTADPYLRAHGRYHLGRVFLDGDDPERAVEIHAAYLREDRNRTPLDAEVMFFYAQGLARIPMPEQALGAFRGFLELFPAAPERYIASATQQRAELESQVDSPLHEIADVMKSVERRIRKTHTGEETQERQKLVMQKLAKIIEEMEEREKASSGAPGGLNVPSAPAGHSAAPPGPTRIGNLHQASNVVDRWGDLQARDRDAIEAELQTKLPGRYREMLEEYYKKLGAGNQ
jgi:hypothetical protein